MDNPIPSANTLDSNVQKMMQLSIINYLSDRLEEEKKKYNILEKTEAQKLEIHDDNNIS